MPGCGPCLPSQRLLVQVRVGVLVPSFFPASVCVQGLFIFDPTLWLAGAVNK